MLIPVRGQLGFGERPCKAQNDRLKCALLFNGTEGMKLLIARAGIPAARVADGFRVL
jgi:hypothetical protein